MRPVMGGSAGDRLREALQALCHPRGALSTSVGVVDVPALLFASDAPSLRTPAAAVDVELDVDALVVSMFRTEGPSLVRLARLFVDDRNAAEDLVQEAFIRLARAAPRIKDLDRAPAYLRSIVLNLARDHNRRGLVSLRHHLPFDDMRASVEDTIDLREDQREVLEALRDLPHRQRECLVLRYYDELGIEAIAETLKLSPNSVKTHLKRGLAALERNLGERTEP
jgi:RNA polymerase sigma factor (sigma-70 family)